MTGTAAPIVKLRCAACWGDARRSASATGTVTKIECGLCKSTILEDAARREADAIARETTSNSSRITQGKPAKYRSGARFVAKVFPEMPRDTDSFDTQIKKTLGLPNKKRRFLTRYEVPAGEAGYLFLQAKLFVAAVRTFPSDAAIQRWEEVDAFRLTSLRVTPSDEMGIHIDAEMQDPTPPETLDERAGVLMMRALMAAFSCELALKAILMTRNHRAKKIHDLVCLYTELPPDSQARVRGGACRRVRDGRARRDPDLQNGRKQDGANRCGSDYSAEGRPYCRVGRKRFCLATGVKDGGKRPVTSVAEEVGVELIGDHATAIRGELR